ncbi:hypothetical protein [Catellatospora methionotrophica]|uniref:hypothetical protein n=1 Tax=Catellatospora methionotrophica TaxID=121620 RepID=UPI0034102CD1
MPTLPRQQPPSAPEPHLHRQVAESFGTDPERYDRARPRYPDALVERRALPDSPFTMPAASASMLDGYQLMLTKAADGIRLAGGFGQAEQWRFDRTRTYTRSGWLDQLATSGALTRLPAGLLAQVLADVGKVIDTMGGTVTVPHTTLAVTATRAV